DDRRGDGDARNEGATAETDAGVALAQMDLAEVVLAHQGDQLPDDLDIERVGSVRRLVRHRNLLKIDSAFPRATGLRVLRVSIEDRRQLTGQMAEYLVAVWCDQDVVLDADAAPARKVDARLDGEDHAGLQHSLRPRSQGRPLMDLQADAVPQAVPEVVAVAGIGDLGSRRGV